MKEYKITYTVDTGEPDCVLDPSDPLYKIKENQLLGNVPGINVFEVFPERRGEESDEKINPFSQH